MEKYSRGWRGAPAKGVGRSRGARVQIPLSPFKLSKNILKKLLTRPHTRDIINELRLRKTKQFFENLTAMQPWKIPKLF